MIDSAAPRATPTAAPGGLLPTLNGRAGASTVEVVKSILFNIAVILISGLVACGGRSSSTNDNPDSLTSNCVGTETRCNGDTFQTCNNGLFENTTACVAPQACSPTLGCADCSPGNGNVCRGSEVVTCNPDGSYGAVVMTCGAGQACGVGGTCERACTADGVDLVYVVDEANRLLSFDPRKLDLAQDPFTLIGTLACQPQLGSVPGRDGQPVTPFSMAVDRDGKAWVMYTSGEIFKVSIQDASCQASPYTARQANLLLFGMGFVTDTAGGTTEKLFVGGGRADTGPNGQLAVIDTSVAAPSPTILGTLSAVAESAPEMTGTSEAKLFAFYPGLSKAYVQGVNKASGAPLGAEFLIPGGLGGQVRAWAFAQWGGKFYIFVTTAAGATNNSTVRVIDRATGAYSQPLQNLPYLIVGAGVSTCAPVVVN